MRPPYLLIQTVLWENGCTWTTENCEHKQFRFLARRQHDAAVISGAAFEPLCLWHLIFLHPNISKQVYSFSGPLLVSLGWWEFECPAVDQANSSLYTRPASGSSDITGRIKIAALMRIRKHHHHISDYQLKANDPLKSTRQEKRPWSCFSIVVINSV